MIDDGKPYIPLEECKHGGLYKISARNFSLGVYDEKAKGFIGVRTKWSDVYLFTEYHWDTGEPYGTVRPKELVGQYPGEVFEGQSIVNEKGEKFYRDNAELKAWLDQKKEQMPA